jgi:hypothetical protein
VTETIGLPDLVDSLGHKYLRGKKHEPRARRRASALPEFAPRILKIHDRYLQVQRKFRRNCERVPEHRPPECNSPAHGGR